MPAPQWPCQSQITLAQHHAATRSERDFVVGRERFGERIVSSQPGLMAPLAAQIAEATGWPLESALMTAALGFSNILLPYAVPPLVVGMQIAGIGFAAAARYTLLLALPSLGLLLPLDYLWWRFIGYFG